MSSFAFIDARVQDYERLIAGLDPGVEVVILDPALDGLVQIADALAGVTDLDSIHIISHGSSGTLYLGSTILTEDNLGDYEAELAQIGAALSEDGDLLLYGCSVGVGTTGQSFIASLADYTGADVAASTDPTGNAALGGDWVLEASTGAIETAAIKSSQFDALLAAPTINTAGGLDTTFGGGDGIVTTPIGTSFDIGRSVVVQADGKILVGGNGFIDGSQSDFALVRYNADGTLDSTFGGGDGIVTTPIGTSTDSIMSVALQVDGRIVVAGTSVVGGVPNFALARYNVDGSLDTTFGGGDGIVTTPVGTFDQLTSMVLQADGRIVVAGYAGNGLDDDFALARYTTAGVLDTTFGGDGIVTMPIGASDDRIFAVALQADGKIVVAGSSIVSGTHYDFALARYNTDGTLDDTFDGDSGGNGIVTTPVGAGIDRITSIMIQPDGKIVVAGWSDPDTSEFGDTHFALARYNSDGTLDVSFDGDGIVITPIGSGRDEINSVVLQTDGKIVVSGFSFGSNNDFAVARYNTDGSLDNTFAGDGIGTYGTGDDVANSVLLQPDGAIVVAGSSVGATTDFALIRVFGGPGIPDVTAAEGGPFSFTFHANTFTDDGPLTYTTSALPDWLDFDAATRTFSGTPGSGDIGDVSITVTASDSVDSVNDIFVLTVEANSAPVLTSLLLDPLFGIDGKVITAIGTGTDQINGVVVQADGKIVVAGFSLVSGTGQDFALARYETDGTLDASFGSGGSDGDGIVVTPLDTGADQINAVILQDGKIVVAGSSFNASSSSNDFALARYNANGTLDASFGSDGNGIVVTEIGTGSDQINAVVLQDGKILVAGFSTVAGSGQEFCIARYGTDDNLDAGFGTGGQVITSIGTGNDVITSLALQSDGKIVVAGYGFTGPTTNVDFALARYTSDGTLDASFGTGGDGIVTTAIGVGASEDKINAVAIQGDGKIVVAGVANLDFALARYNTDGTLDDTFDGDGKVTTGIDIDIDSITSLVLQTDGKIVVAGVSFSGSSGTNDFAVARYNTDGSLDTTFDDDGIFTTGMGTNQDRATSLVLQPDGSIVVAGNASGDFGLLRFRPFIEDQSASEDSAFSYTPAADTFVDPEGHALAYSATLANGSPLSTTWLSFNPNTRTFAGTPENDDVGALAVKLIATDNWGASSSTVFNINVTDTNDAPTPGTPISAKTAQVNTAFNFTIPANAFDDIDVGDSLTYPSYSAVRLGDEGPTLPAWLILDDETGVFSGAPGNSDFLGSYQITITADDGDATATADFLLSIPTGGQNADSLTGTTGSDTIDGGGGADTMIGLQGDDRYIVGSSNDVIVEQGSQGDDAVEASVTYTLSANVEDLFLTGSAANGVGNNLNNQITGNSAANRLDGGSNDDILTGGLGNDTYVVDNTNDQVNEDGNQGTDIVEANHTVAGTTFVLDANVEKLTLMGTAAINAQGNTLNNTLTGNSGNNNLLGSSGNDSLVGDAGNDTLNGGTGNDTMVGGLGNDTYVMDSLSDVVTEVSGGGTDVIQSSVSVTALAAHVENLILTGTAALSGTGNVLLNRVTGNSANNVLIGGDGNDTLNGGGGNDTLRGGAGNDVLDGGAGTDRMEGGTGNDVFHVDRAADVVVELAGGGTADQVVISINFTTNPQAFQLYDNVELVSVADVNGGGVLVIGNALDNLFEGGNGDDSLAGAAGDDTLDGAGGEDTLNGGSGVDSMLGGNGSDLYYVDHADDEVIENGNGPEALADGPAGLDSFTDTVVAAVTYSLQDVAFVENLTLSSTATSGTGNELNNVITGNSSSNQLAGLSGNDTIEGGKGKDTASGGGGNDRLEGDGGKDILTGGTGKDKFEFDTALNASTNVDRIPDFRAVDDTIQLDRTIFTKLATGNLAAGAFHEGSAAHDTSDRIIYNGNTGSLYYDADGNGGNASAILFATLAGAPNIAYTDFFIVA